MNIAINPEAPQYRASVKLIPVETTDMKIVNKYRTPLVGGMFVLAAWAIMTAAGFFAGTITL